MLTRDAVLTVRTTPPSGDEPYDLAGVRETTKPDDPPHGPAVFTGKVELAFNLVYEKLMRALEGLELSRDLLASVRDYHQAKIAQDQNDVMKKLTAIASILRSQPGTREWRSSGSTSTRATARRSRRSAASRSSPARRRR